MVAKKDMEIVKLAFIAAIVSVGGWLVFQGVTKFLGLQNLTPLWSIIIGLGIVYLTFKLGFRK